MGFLQRLLSVDYRRALAAEAQGDYLTAARHYALCGDMGKVADMHLAQARSASDLDDRVRSFRTALSFAPTGDSRRSMILRLLARALRARALEARTGEEDRRQDLEEAATLLDEAGAPEAAAECYVDLGNPQRAAAAYAKAGLVEKVEEVLSATEADRNRQRQEDGCYADYELLLQGGQRDEALEALRRCIEVAQDKGDYRRLLADLEGRLLSSGRITLEHDGTRLTLIGHSPMVLGRDSDCDLQARAPSVSRRHAHIFFSEAGEFSLADAGSRNGTWLNGLRIGAPLPLPGEGTIGLGEDCQIAYRPCDGGEVLRLEVTRGLDQGRQAAVGLGPFDLSALECGFPPIRITFARGRPLAETATGATLWLNRAITGGPAQLLKTDRLELDGATLTVID